MRIVTLLARHGTQHYPAAVDELDALFARQLPHVRREVVIADNSLPEYVREPSGPDRVLIGCSNAYGEFSAWDAALSYLGRRIAAYDLVHLATSAFHTLYVRYLNRFDPDMLGLIVGRSAAVGHIDYYNDPVMLCSRSTQAWLRTSWMFLPPHELRVLGSLVSIEGGGSLFSGDPDSPFRTDAPLSANYQKYILDWLTGGGTGQGVEWHSRFGLTSATLGRFEAKAIAILNEQMLGIRLRAQGCAMVDATWLATRCAQLNAGQSLGAIPAWRWQITARDTDAAPADLIARQG